MVSLLWVRLRSPTEQAAKPFDEFYNYGVIVTFSDGGDKGMFTVTRFDGSDSRVALAAVTYQ
jgi:hypothetical protein